MIELRKGCTKVGLLHSTYLAAVNLISSTLITHTWKKRNTLFESRKIWKNTKHLQCPATLCNWTAQLLTFKMIQLIICKIIQFQIVEARHDPDMYDYNYSKAIIEKREKIIKDNVNDVDDYLPYLRRHLKSENVCMTSDVNWSIDKFSFLSSIAWPLVKRR